MQKFTLTTIFLALLGVTLFSGCFGYAVNTNSFPETTSAYKRSSPVKGWQQIEIFEEDEPTAPYKEVATIVVTGNQHASMDKLFKKMKKEAGRYAADAIIYWGDREVNRSSFNGFSTAVNVITIFDGSGDEWLDMGGEYYTTEIAGVAVKYTSNETD